MNLHFFITFWTFKNSPHPLFQWGKNSRTVDTDIANLNQEFMNLDCWCAAEDTTSSNIKIYKYFLWQYLVTNQLSHLLKTFAFKIKVSCPINRLRKIAFESPLSRGHKWYKVCIACSSWQNWKLLKPLDMLFKMKDDPSFDSSKDLLTPYFLDIITAYFHAIKFKCRSHKYAFTWSKSNA